MKGGNRIQGFEKRLFSLHDEDGITVENDDKIRIIEFIKQNFYPLLSLTSIVEKAGKERIKILDKGKIVFLTLDAVNNVVSFQSGKKKEDFVVSRAVPIGEKKKEYYVFPRDIFQGPGHKFVGSSGIILTTIYLILLSLTIIYGLVQVWPPQASSLSPVAPISTVTFLQWTYPISDEGRLFVIVALAGALGSVLHVHRSFYTYVGERKLVKSWLAYYITLPISGATLGLIFYITVRGGLFPNATLQQTSPFGFAALAALVGLFSVQALEKLKDIANTMFTEPPQNSDHYRKPADQTQDQGNNSNKDKSADETKKQENNLKEDKSADETQNVSESDKENS